MKRAVVLPASLSLAAVEDACSDRAELLAVLTFVEGATSGWGPCDLLDWFDTHAAAMSRGAPPTCVADAVIGSIALSPGAEPSGARIARADDLPKLLALARARVIGNARGLLLSPRDDGFLKAAVEAGRVRREGAGWIVVPSDADLLGDAVLNLLAADVLGHRDFYEQHLCVCELCGRISFDPGATTRSGCADHLPKSTRTSGFQDKGRSIPPTIPPSRDR